MKNLPNMITLIRIICSVSLFFFKPLSTTFLILYITCGISDVLDVYIARKIGYVSDAGAIFDSLADVIFIFSIMIILIPIINWLWWMIAWIVLIILIRVISLVIGLVKYRAVTFLHTYGNKVTGVLVFCFPFFYKVFNLEAIICLISAAATVSAVEEMSINIISKELVRDIKSIFMINEGRE